MYAVLQSVISFHYTAIHDIVHYVKINVFRLVLRSSQPLLKSRNSGVVLGVCMLHYYCGSHSTSITQQIGKSLVRILRDRR